MRTRFLLLPLLLSSAFSSLAQRTAATQVVVQPPQPPTCFLAPAPMAGSYRFRMDSLMTALNKAQVPTAILYDRVFPLARLDVFGQSAADTSRFAHFLQANQELWYASYACTGLNGPADVRARAAQQQRVGIVPIGVLHYRFNLLDTLAVPRTLFNQPGGNGGALYDVAGRTQSPYLTRETLVAAALVESVPAGTVQFKLPTNLRLDNTGNAVQSLTLEYNDGSAAATLLPGGAAVYKAYTTAGEYFIRLTARFADGSSKATFTSLRITGQATVGSKGTLARNNDPNFPIIFPCSPSQSGIALSNPMPFLDYEGNSYSGVGKVTTYFANCNNQQLVKPVIMLDGIDFGGQNQRVGTDVYSDFLNYYDQGIPKRLGEELRAAGNDIIILDFPDANGAEYIQRNAFVLIQLIQNVNADLRSRGSSEKLTVIGPSMGGLVSRYALAYMEKKFNDANDPNTYQKPEWNHNTRLWMSFDSPQLGANIPIGDQQWLRYYKEIFEVEAAEKNLANLDNAASKEMLVHHYRSTSRNVSGTPGFRDRFQAEIDALGMPAQLRRIAVVNGSIGGIRQDWRDNSRKANGCDMAFRFEARLGAVRLFYLKFLTVPSLQRVKLSDSRVFFSPDYGQTCLTFDGSGFTKSSRREFTIGRSGSIGYDVAPGSWRATQADIASAGTATNAPIKGFFANVFLGGMNRPSQTSRFYDVVDKHCFIPTASALALTNPNRDLGQNLSSIDLVCSGETPFDSYFAPTQNDEHITVTAANAAYIKDEIRFTIPTPLFVAAPTAMCPGGTATFSVKAECARAGQPATTYTWTLGNGLQYAPGSTGTGPSQGVQAIAGFLGYATVTVRATRAGYTSAPVAQQLVHVTPANLAVRPPVGTVCMQQGSFTVTVQSENIVGPFTWSVTPINCALADESGAGARLSPTRTGNVTVTLTATNSCTNQRKASSVTVSVTTCPSPTGARPAAYPNPADAVLNLATPETAEAAAVPRTAVLYNGQGREVRRNSRTAEAQLLTADLSEGLYYLLVEQNGHVTRSQIRVQH